MKDSKEIILFYKDKTNSFKPVDVAKELMERYPELGNPIILPESKNKNNPLVVFNENMDFQLQTSYTSLTFAVNHHYFDKLTSIIFDMVDTMEGFYAPFSRIGYISNNMLSPTYIDKAKERFFKLDYLEDLGDFNFSWYKKITTKKCNINCWERVITDKLDFPDLLMQYDMNSPINESVKFDMKYIKEFINTCNEYIESRLEF